MTYSQQIADIAEAQAKCAHEKTHGQANVKGDIEFRCLSCLALVKTIYQGGVHLVPKSEVAHEKLEYAKVCLNPGGKIVYDESAGIPGKLPWGEKEKPMAHWKPLKPTYHSPLKPILVKNPTAAMKNGDVRKLPTVNSPMWTTQWAVQGSAWAPYVVSLKKFQNGTFDGNVTDKGWACSCPDFTRHVPRTECKHILKVMMIEGIKPNAPPVANLPDDQQEAFRKFLLQQAANGTPALPAGKSKPFVTQGRRFR